jgi:hypothetical protein
MTDQQLESIKDYVLLNPEATHQDAARFGYGLVHEEIKELKTEIKELREQLTSLLSHKL